jgi:hypothetical protein
MNAKERIEWLKAVACCFPEHETGPMAAAALALDGPGRWEVSVRGGGLHMIGLRFFGSGPYAPWRAKFAPAFALAGAALPSGPVEGFPWLTASWDLRTGDWISARLMGANGSKLKPGSALAWDFARGEPGSRRRALVSRPFKPGVFKEPALDQALADSSQLALFLLDRKVTELSFDGDALWAHCAG